jgi:phosphatidylinositol glycan class B
VIDTRLYNTSWDFQELIFTPFLFFKVNVVNSISLFYGVHTWHWYLTQGIPIIFTTFLPFLVYGFYCIYTDKTIYHRFKTLLFLSVWVIIIYSLLPHKEFRFIFPIVPILLMVVAYAIQHIGSLRWRKRIILFLITTQLPLALYLSLWHQRGVIDVMLWMRTQPVKSIGILMPCHSTPWSSILHKDIPMWFLTCEPPLKETTLDEADLFYQDPIDYLNTMNHTWPTHLVLFDQLKIDDYLKEMGYIECKRFFNSHFHDDARRKGDVLVMCQS